MVPGNQPLEVGRARVKIHRVIVEDEQDVIGWALFLKCIRGDSDARAYVGCPSPAHAIAMFKEESEDFSEDDVKHVIPILDFRLYLPVESHDQQRWKRYTCGKCKFWAHGTCFIDNNQLGNEDARWWHARACTEFVKEE